MIEKSDEIVYEVKDGVALMTLNRPAKMNAITPYGFSKLCKYLQESDADSDVKVVAITGAGSRAFCAGFDFVDAPDLPVLQSRMFDAANLELNKRLMDMSKVTISAVNGAAFGAGFEISLLCDLTIAVQSATFGMPELTVGLYPGSLGSLLWHMIGAKKTKELLLTCRTVNANEAMEMGLANEVVPGHRLMTRVFEMAAKIASMPPLPVATFKARSNRMARVLLEEDMGYFVEVQTMARGSKDFREGIAAFREKRKPVFEGSNDKLATIYSSSRNHAKANSDS